MYTQCPHCLTLFRIGSDELKAAAGQARCCQCNQVFNALETLQEQPRLHISPDQAWPEEETSNLDADLESAVEDGRLNVIPELDDGEERNLAPAMDSDTPYAPDSTPLDPSFLIKDDGLETEPDYFAAGSESQMSALLNHDSTPFIGPRELPEPENEPKTTLLTRSDEVQEPAAAPPANQANASPESASHGKERESAEPDKPRFHFTERQKDEMLIAPRDSGVADHFDDLFEKQPRPLAGYVWGAASLLFVLLVLLQLSWLYREQVIRYEPGRQLLSQLCRVVGCITPERRDTSRIIVQHRDLRSHPSKPDALLLQLRMVNGADFPQPFPKLHLSLFNDRDKLIASRTFEPLEYLPDPALLDDLMQPSEPVYVNMELQDPGKDVTGFKFEFL